MCFFETDGGNPPSRSRLDTAYDAAPPDSGVSTWTYRRYALNTPPPIYLGDTIFYRRT